MESAKRYINMYWLTKMEVESVYIYISADTSHIKIDVNFSKANLQKVLYTVTGLKGVNNLFLVFIS